MRVGLGASALKMDASPPLVLNTLLPTGRFAGRETFAQRVRDALAIAARDGWREIVVCDPTFADWPLGESAVQASLQAWAKQGRRFTMLAIHYDEVRRRHARFVTWRTTWSHLLECRACPSASPQDLPSALYSPVWALQRLDVESSTGMCGDEPQRRVLLRQNLDAWWGKSSPAFSASVLGL